MKLIHTFVLLALSASLYAQGLTNTSVPKISFKESIYFVEEGEDIEVCLELKNFSSNYQGKAKIQNKLGDATFLASTNIELPLINGEFCYTLSSQATNNETDSYNTQILEIQYDLPQDSVITSSPLSETTIFLKDDKPLVNDPSVPLFLIKGFDNNVDDAFSLSIITTQYIEPGTKFKITNANYLNGSWAPKEGEVFEYIDVEWKGNYLLSPGSVICISPYDERTPTSSFNRWKILLDNEQAAQNFETYDNVTNRFLRHDIWSNIYLLKMFNSENLEDIYDGITFGIDSIDFEFDIPFEDENSQLFFFESYVSGFGYVDCHPHMEGCELVEYYNDFVNWVYDTGQVENTLNIENVCSRECEEDCLDIEIDVISNCEDKKIDFLFLLDRSGSIVNQGEFGHLQEIVANVSSYLDCESDEIRFAAASFAGNGSFTIIEDFQYNPLDISYYNPPGGGTNVYNAYKKLKLSIDNGDLVPRNDASLFVLTISDAPSYNGNGVDPYDIYNTLKTGDYNIKNYIIHFKDDNTLVAEKEAATASSRFGPYQGILDSNPGDPEGEGPPRHLYIYNSITSEITDAVESITACDVIEFIVPNEINSTNTTIEASNNGEIVSYINSYTIETNGIGLYTIKIKDLNGCEYTQSYEFYETIDCDGILDGGETDPPEDDPRGEKNINNKENISRHQLYENGFFIGKVEKQLEGLSAVLYPNPAFEMISIKVTNSKTSTYSLNIYDSSGKKVKSVYSEKVLIKIEIDDYTSGLYSIVIKDQLGNTIVKKFVVSK